MKRYIAFVMERYVESGGWGDVLDDESGIAKSFDSIEEAKAAVLADVESSLGKFVDQVEFQIVDISVGRIVLAGGIRIPSERALNQDLLVEIYLSE